MNPEVRQKWVEALRSGDYEQTVGYLHIGKPDSNHEPAGYCCLGVLCELAVKSGVKIDVYEKSTAEGSIFSYSGHSQDLPVEVKTWAGLDDAMPYVQVESDGYLDNLSLADENDTGRTFGEIADLIESQSDDWAGGLREVSYEE